MSVPWARCAITVTPTQDPEDDGGDAGQDRDAERRDPENQAGDGQTARLRRLPVVAGEIVRVRHD